MNEHLTPWERYQQDCRERGFQANHSQGLVLRAMENCLHALQSERQRRDAWWWRLLRRRPKPVSGLYIWGPVGTGKSYCMNVFYQSIPGQRKLRVHFHEFMHEIQQQLQQHQGQVDPLPHIIADIAATIDVLFFDEFLVGDITNAMILRHVLQALFDHGVTLVASSNTEPDRLYWKGLRRERFIPAIRLLKQHVQVFECDAGVDFRRVQRQALPVYFTPISNRSAVEMARAFEHFAEGEGQTGTVLTVLDRPIQTVRCAERVVWFEFSELCQPPRGTADYLQLVKQFSVVCLQGVPELTVVGSNRVLHFINLIDVLYDQGVVLVMSAEAMPARLYLDGPHFTEFQRTQSRLFEMTHGDWLQRHGWTT